MKVKRPNDRMLIGNVKIIKSGLMTALINPRTKAVTMAAKKLSIFVPGNKYAVIIIAKVATIQCMKVLIVYWNKKL